VINCSKKCAFNGALQKTRLKKRRIPTNEDEVVALATQKGGRKEGIFQPQKG
jgi:hypothetical protein